MCRISIENDIFCCTYMYFVLDLLQTNEYWGLRMVGESDIIRSIRNLLRLKLHLCEEK